MSLNIITQMITTSNVYNVIAKEIFIIKEIKLPDTNLHVYNGCYPNESKSDICGYKW